MSGLFSTIFLESNPIFLLASVCCIVDHSSNAYCLDSMEIICHVVPYLRDPFDYRNGGTGTEIPGPLIAKLSDFWLSRKAVLGDRSREVHKVHQKYDSAHRANHISVADPAAIQIIYAHGNGSLKTDFYDAFVTIHRGLFNTRDRAEHARKRKIVSSIFSQKNVLGFEPHIRAAVALLFKKWDDFYDTAVIRKEVTHEGCFQGRDCRFNYLAFDIIGDLAFGTPFGMLEAGRDAAPVLAPGETPDKTRHLPAIEILNDRGTYSASLGVTPVWSRPLVKRLPWFARGCRAVDDLVGVAVAAVEKRIQEPSDRTDLLARLQQARDAEGKPMGRAELTAELLTQLIAGSDSTANASCIITFYLALNPDVQHKLQAELDEALGPTIITDSHKNATANCELAVAPYDIVKSLPYLEACIYEALRVHPPSGIGLPRAAPAGGLMVAGRYYKEGSILSVPTSPFIAIRMPERWFERDAETMYKGFNAFSWGPRACVGRNLAHAELAIIIASIFKRYDVVLENPAMTTLEGFLRKPLSCRVGMKRREA
ncbi:hypothetical protein BS47DRAFT_1357238 [Hydnum rufescens UP504]|uniref:Uncharacterized protein n=1 Tax=Hydnum rufescens UP504 TaxID=1448309 RepID=A0A9P6BB57_9AGAM|nr:hypothetical protein BS47DRAFT_1357238 [Hydnum rufescens UP504]